MSASQLMAAVESRQLVGAAVPSKDRRPPSETAYGLQSSNTCPQGEIWYLSEEDDSDRKESNIYLISVGEAQASGDARTSPRH